jgi:hypothetical protein
VVGEEWSTIRGDSGNDVGIVEAHETKGRGETLLIIRFSGVAVGRRILGNALGDGGRVIEGMIGRVTELGGRNGSRIAIVNGVVTVIPKVVKI